MRKTGKGLFYIEIKDYKGPVIMKISNQAGKLIETHYLMYSGLTSWRLGSAIWKVRIEFERLQYNTYTVVIQ